VFPELNFLAFLRRSDPSALHPPATAGGTDRTQMSRLIFEAKRAFIDE
jgi:hypothetical protein